MLTRLAFAPPSSLVLLTMHAYQCHVGAGLLSDYGTTLLLPLLAEIVLLLILLGSCGPAVQALLEMMHAQRRQSSRATGAKCYTASAADSDVEEDDEAGVNKGGKVGTAAALL